MEHKNYFVYPHSYNNHVCASKTESGQMRSHLHSSKNCQTQVGSRRGTRLTELIAGGAKKFSTEVQELEEAVSVASNTTKRRSD